MKISAIDIGSNSVRLAMFAGGKTLYKRISTTRLGENLCFTGKMSEAAMLRTANAVAEFKSFANSDGAEKVYVFATAAVRSSSNREEFLALVKKMCGADIDVISGEEEAACGILGALRGKDGGMIDVGGASTEIDISKNNKTLYSKSVNIGAVRLFDIAGRDRKKLEAAIAEKIVEYGDVPAKGMRMYAIGGTATTLAAVKHGFYDPEVTDGTVISVSEIFEMSDKFISLPVEEVKKIPGMEVKRADVIGGSCLLLGMIMQKFGIEDITVSESDNLEGYVLRREGTL